MIKIIGPRDKVPEGFRVIDVTSHATDCMRQLSPFLLGPVELYGGRVSETMENAWQYCKVYPQFADENGDPTQKYFEWAQKGWSNPRAVRYTMGKGVKPLYSYWDGEKLGYITARRRIYIPLYVKAAKETEAFKQLQKLVQEQDVCLFDFDGYDIGDLSFEEVVEDSSRIMGHSVVLAMMIYKDIMHL